MPQFDLLKTVLKREGLYVEEKFEEWVALARTTGQTLDRILTAAGYLTEKQMLQVFGECLHLPVVDRLAEATVPARFVERIPVHSRATTT
jgi:hypothetical protein